MKLSFQKVSGAMAGKMAYLVIGASITACTEDALKTTLDGASSDPTRAGISEALRRVNGTIAVTLRGMKGVYKYEIYEVETASPDTTEGNETRVLRSILHSPGKVDYQVETNDIPFGKNFCYKARAQMSEVGEKIPLKIAACLQDNNSWSFSGIKQARADQTGAIVLNWSRVPTDGVTYKIFRRYADTETTYKADATKEVYDKSEFIDEVTENVFPRCYVVRASHALFSKIDSNLNEICISKETFTTQVMSTPDALAPDFAGIQTISVVDSSDSSLLDQAAQAIGMQSAIKVRLTWSKANDNLSPPYRIRYRIYRSEKLDLNDSDIYATTEPGVLFFVDKNVPAKRRFNYLVRAVDDRNNMDGNFNWKELPLDFDPPLFAGISNAVPERKEGNVQIRLSWETASDNKTTAAGVDYLVYRAPKGDPINYAEPIATVRGENSYVDSAVSRNALYIYAVRARDEGSNIERNLVTKEAKATGAGPQFRGLSYLGRSGSAAVLSWSQATDDDSLPNEIAYAVYRSTSESDFKMENPIFRTTTNVTQATDPTADVTATYYYRVRAVDKNGFEDDNRETKTLAANTPPVWPLNTRPNSAGPEWKSLSGSKLSWEKTERGALLQWSPPTDDYTTPAGLTYYIYKSDRSNGFANLTTHLAKVTPVAGSDQLTYVDKSGHEFGQTWFYMIRAEDEFKSISLNSSVAELPSNTKPSKPVITGVLLDKNTQRVTIEWNTGIDDRSSTAELNYRVYRFEQNTNGTYPLAVDKRIATLDGSKTSYIDSSTRDLTKNYVWIVQVVDATNLESDPSDPRSLGQNTPPSAGGVVSALRSSNELITLTWTPSDDAQETVLSYRVYAKEVAISTTAGLTTDPTLVGDLFADANLKQTVTGNTTVLTFGNFARNKAYVFGVRAFDSMGLFDANQKGAVISGNPPPIFAGLAQAQLIVDTSKARLTWVPGSDDSPSSELDYRIYKWETTNPTATSQQVIAQGIYLTTAGTGRTSFEDPSVNPRVTTHYVVRCVDPIGSEESNTVVRSIAPDTSRPSFLGIKTATMGTYSPTSDTGRRITLTWDPASDNRTSASQIKYKVYQSTSNSVADLLATQCIAEVGSWPEGSTTQCIAKVEGSTSFNGLDGSGTGHLPPNNLTHYYLVRAVDEASNTDTNGVVRQTTDAIPPAFDGLQNGFAITNRSIQLFWTSVPNEDIYSINIFRSDNTNTPVATVNARNSKGAWVNSYLVTGLTPATTYTYIARAVDGAGNTETNMASVTVTTLAGEAPTFAGLQKADPAAGVDGLSQIALGWSAADNVTKYRIFRVIGPSAVGAEFNFNYDTCSGQWASPTQPGCLQLDAKDGNGDTITSYTVTGLSKNTQYSFIVRAVTLSNGDVVGEEQNRTIFSPRTLDEVAPTLAGAKSAVPAAGDAGLTSIVVKWDSPARNGVWDGFLVLYKDLSTAASSVTSFTVPTLLSQDPGIVSTTIADIGATEATISGLTFGKRYCFTVVTRYLPISSVRSAPTNPAGFICSTPTAQAPSFTGVKSAVVKGIDAQAFRQFTVSWDAAVGSFTKYEVSWSKNNDFVSVSNTGSFFNVPANTATVNNRNTTAYTILNLEPNTNYYVRVRAVFERIENNLRLDSGSLAVTQNLTSPIIPNGDGVLSAIQTSDDEIEVKWDAPNNNGFFNNYYIFRASGVNAETDVLAQSATVLGNTPHPFATQPAVTVGSNASQFNTRTFNNIGIVPDTRYCFLIKAAYSGSEGFVASPNSKIKCVDVVIAPPDFNGITSLSAPVSASGFTSLVAKWTQASGNFTRYEFSATTSSDAAPVWMNLGTSSVTASFTIPNLTPNTRYYVRIRAVYEKSPRTYTAGESAQVSAVTTPKAPQHAGLQPIEFLGAPGEVKITWDKPSADPEIGGLFDRYFVWKVTPGTPSTITDEINALLTDSNTPGVISYNETTGAFASSYKVDEITNTAQTSIEYRGANALAQNLQTCFLVRAAYRQSNDSTNFVMSGNLAIQCVTPTASAPQFSGIATLENIPNTVNGFGSVKATWIPAIGNFTRYEAVLSTVTGSNTWTPRAATGNDKAETFKLLSNLNESGSIATALSNFTHQTVYGRVRAIYQAVDNTVYAAGESREIAVAIRPDRPAGDGIRSATASKVPGYLPSASILIKGNATGFWDKAYIWREVADDQGTAYNAVLAKAKANDAGTAFAASPQFSVSRPGTNSTTDFTYTDTTVALGKYNCYIARSGYSLSPNFLLSVTPQEPICLRPQFDPISFSGVATSGSQPCDYENPSAPVTCNANQRWPYTGNSMVRLRLAAAPTGDIDFYDVYMGSSSNPTTLLASAPFQKIAKGDAVHDPDATDVYLHVGGTASLFIPSGNQYFLVRARCLGCSYTDVNTNVSNAVNALQPFIRASYRMNASAASSIRTQNDAAYGALEDEAGLGVLGASGLAELTGDSDYLRSTNPIAFAPKPGTTFAIKFSLLDAGSTLQNVEGSAVFAADVGNRAPRWRDTAGSTYLDEGSLLGAPGASTVYDQRNKTCLFIGGYAGQGFDLTDNPSRSWGHDPSSFNKFYALRFQAWDGQNLGEIRTRGTSADSPLPRSMPVVAYNPVSGNVMLFGGMDQDVPTQRLRADTWEWDGMKWRKLSDGPQTNQMVDGEVGRYGHGVMAFDPFSNRMIMVGGRYKAGNPLRSACCTNWSFDSRSTNTGTNFPDLDVIRDVRNDKMWSWGTDTNGAPNWIVSATLPASFPKGYPAQLVTVPSGPGMGIYYFSARWDSFENSTNSESNDVWKYDGSSWSQIPNSRWTGGLRPFANLYGAWDATKQRIVITFGRGNTNAGMVIWEYDPANSANGSAAWTTRTIANSPGVMNGAQPCFHEDTRDLVIPGGMPDGTANASVLKRSQTAQDVFVFSSAGNTWRQHTLRYSPSSRGMMAPHETLRGIFQTGGPQWQPFAGWGEISSGFQNLIFKNGVWSEIPINPALKMRWWWQHGSVGSSNTNSPNFWLNDVQRFAGRFTAAGSGDVAGIIKSDNRAFSSTTAPQAVVEYGQPRLVASFGSTGVQAGTGWSSKTVTSTSLTLPTRSCTNPAVTPAANNTIAYPQFPYPWTGVNTSRGIFAVTQYMEAFWPYNFGASVTCGATEAWRYRDAPFILISETTSEARVNEIKPPSDPGWTASETNKWCNPTAPIHSNYLSKMPYMQVDPNDTIWLFGSRNNNGDMSLNWASTFFTAIQSISYNAPGKCYQVMNYTAPFISIANTTLTGAPWNTGITSANNGVDSWGYDPTRNVITVFGKASMSTSITQGVANGVIWELTLGESPVWRERRLPDQFNRWSAIQGNYNMRVAQIPGKIGEYYVAAAVENGFNQSGVYAPSRPISDAYILRVTGSSITMVPTLPRFGLTLGNASGGDGSGTAGFLSVPGDQGDVDRVYAGETLYRGRRKIADNLLGDNDLFIVFGTNDTYTAYLNGVVVANNVTWDGAGGLYMMDFMVGARYGTYYLHNDVSSSGYKGIGNTNVRVDWIRTFTKSLDATERSFWRTFDDNAP